MTLPGVDHLIETGISPATTDWYSVHADALRLMRSITALDEVEMIFKFKAARTQNAQQRGVLTAVHKLCAAEREAAMKQLHKLQEALHA